MADSFPKGGFPADKPASKGKSKVPAPVVKAVAKAADKPGGKFDPSVFLTSGVPSTQTGPKSGRSADAKLVDAARRQQQSRQRELRGKTMRSPYPGA